MFGGLRNLFYVIFLKSPTIDKKQKRIERMLYIFELIYNII